MDVSGTTEGGTAGVDRRKLIIAGIVLVIVGALGLRIWWCWPQELDGGPHLENIVKRGRDYSLRLKPGSVLADIAALHVFEGYTPSNHFDFMESMENRPSRYVEAGDHHRYEEYIGTFGRMQFHSSFVPDFREQEGEASEWFEFLPSKLSLDSFLAEEVAVNLDLSEPAFKVYISMKPEHMYMTIDVKNRNVDRIIWGYSAH